MRHILLVEDDTSLGESLKERLMQNYLVTWANSKAQALVAFQNEKIIDLVILDLGLPDGSGFDLANPKNFGRHTPSIIFLTAQSDAESRLKGYELGAEEFIPKPFQNRNKNFYLWTIATF